MATQNAPPTTSAAGSNAPVSGQVVMTSMDPMAAGSASPLPTVENASLLSKFLSEK